MVVREIKIANAEFDKLRTDKRFAKLLNLARVLNAIYFCSASMLDKSVAQYPLLERQQLNAFLFSTGALYEGLIVADTLETFFGERETYRAGFGEFLKEAETTELRTLLRTMRDKFVFHFDEDVARKILKRLALPSYVFATNIGLNRKGTYYNLADEAALNYLLRNCQSQEEEDRMIRSIFDALGKGISRYVQCGDVLIADVLSEGSWKVHERNDSEQSP